MRMPAEMRQSTRAACGNTSSWRRCITNKMLSGLGKRKPTPDGNVPSFSVTPLYTSADRHQPVASKHRSERNTHRVNVLSRRARGGPQLRAGSKDSAAMIPTAGQIAKKVIAWGRREVAIISRDSHGVDEIDRAEEKRTETEEGNGHQRLFLAQRGVCGLVGVDCAGRKSSDSHTASTVKRVDTGGRVDMRDAPSSRFHTTRTLSETLQLLSLEKKTKIVPLPAHLQGGGAQILRLEGSTER